MDSRESVLSLDFGSSLMNDDSCFSPLVFCVDFVLFRGGVVRGAFSLKMAGQLISSFVGVFCWGLLLCARKVFN